ncbi:MAG: 4-alpha-glucanotransferase, partial [Aeromonadaceae bacterium]
MTTLIEQLATAKGIANDYVDAWGNPALVTLESKAAMLAAMGYKVDDEAALQAQLEEEKRQHWQAPLDPVMVVRVADAIALELRLPITLVNEELTWEVATEQGETVKGTLVPVDGEMVNVAHFDEVEYQAYRVSLSNELPLGYHELSLKKGRKALGSMRLIVAPKACYKQEQIAQGRKVWGPSIQLYCLRSEKNWGVGDFTDLGMLVDNMAKWGAHFVGLNPIHALYPANPESASPYSPSSRRWLNVIYIDVTAVPEYQQNAAVKAEVESAEFQQRLQALRDKEWVDYTGVTQAKLEVLRKVFAGAKLAKNTNRGKAFAAFIAEGGDSLMQQAVYDALQASLYAEGQNAWGWPAWPEEFREYHKPAVAKWAAEHEADVRFYMYLQFLADEQLAQADAIAKKSGMVMGIYRDLAVGVSEGSTEIWANSELYCPKASVGAPPDVLGPLGQNWG